MLEADDAAGADAPGDDVTLTWAARRAVRCCGAGRRSSVRRPPTSTRSRRRWTAPTSTATTPSTPRAPTEPPRSAAGRSSIGGGVVGRPRVVGGVLAVTGGGDSRRRATAAATGAGGPAADSARDADACGILNWRSTSTPPRTAPSARVDRFTRTHRDRRQLHRELQRQQRGVQPGVRRRSSAPARRRLGHRLPDELDGRPAQEPGLDRAAAVRPASRTA